MYHRSLLCSSHVMMTVTRCMKQASRETCGRKKMKKKKKDVLADVEKPKVLIIGAGMAGLSAAAELIKNGIKDITILEATDRPGGRIHSCWLGTSVAEIGAQWITGGTISNSIFTLACQEGLLDPKCMYRYNFENGIYMMSNGEAVSNRISYHAYLTFKEIKKQAMALYHMGSSSVRHGNLMNFFMMRIEQELSNFPPAHKESARRILYGLTNKICNRWGASLTSMNADLFGYYMQPTGETVGIPLGFIGIISPLLKVIPLCNIKYSKIVDRITYADLCDCRAMVRCCDTVTYKADYIICTISLGVLKSECCTLFNPFLPAEKMEAIRKLGYGTICKIFFEYKRPFWLSKQGPIKFAWSLDELNDKDDWLKGVACLEELSASNNILMATVSGSRAKNVEKLTDQRVAEDLTHMLRCITRDQTLPYPNSVLRSKWYSSPFFRGTNMYMSKGSTIGHQIDLRRPLTNPEEVSCTSSGVPVVFFAGEATSKNLFSTVNGARQSGLKVAGQIVELTKRLQGRPPHPGLRQEKDCSAQYS